MSSLKNAIKNYSFFWQKRKSRPLKVETLKIYWVKIQNQKAKKPKTFQTRKVTLNNNDQIA